MNINLTSHHEAMIREKVASGRYNNSSEVVREALRLLEERDKLDRLRVAIAVAEEELAQGKGRPYTPELLAEINLEADRMIRERETPDPDVCP